VGTGYVVTEASPNGYTTSYSINGGAAVPASMDDRPVAANNLSTPLTRVTDIETSNTAAFTNNRDYIAPAGLSMNDLPFVGLILLALGALATFVVVKARKGKANNR